MSDTTAADVRQQARRAVADLIWSAGCGCCGDREAREEAIARLAKLLRIPKYSDGSGYDFGRYRTKAGGSHGGD